MTLEFPPSPLWTPSELRKITGGRWVREPDANWFPTGIIYNRTQARPGDIFLAMDSVTHARAGHVKPSKKPWDRADRLERMVAAGMPCAIVQRELGSAPPDDLSVLRVDDCPLALQNLAIAARERFEGRVISVTGTAGKTTVREMLQFVLSRQGRASSSRWNFNTCMGVLLTLAQTPRENDYAVYEIAVSALNKGIYDQKQTANYHVRSNMAVFTSIGLAHTQFGGSLEEIADSKSRIFNDMQPDAIAIINRDMPVSDRVLDSARNAGVRTILTFGGGDTADMRLKDWQGDAGGSFVRASFFGETVEFYFPVPSYHMVMNSLAVLCGVAALGGDWKKAAGDLAEYRTASGRLEVREIAIPGGSFHLVDDAFNATSSSMAAGLDMLRLMQPAPGGRRLAALGRIVELGNSGPRIMRGMGKKVIESRIDRLFTIHDELLDLRAAVPEKILATHAQTTAGLASMMLQEVRPADIVFVKASHRYSDFHMLPQYLRFGPPGEGRAESGPRGPGTLLGRLVGRSPETDAPRLSLRDSRQVNVCFLGDTYFGETYQSARERKGKKNYLTKSGHGHGLLRFRTMLRAVDASIASFAAPLAMKEPRSPGGTGKRLHWADPSQTLEALKEHNIRAVSMAGAHVFDHGTAGLRQTLGLLARQSLPVLGAGDSEARACRPLLLSSTIADRQENVAIFAGLRHSDEYGGGFEGYAAGRRAGLADLGGTIPAIAAWRGANPKDRIIAFVQWGEPYRWRDGAQQRLADELIEAGADLIIGAGAHRFQEIDRRQGKWVVYNLGNFVFGSDGAYKRHNAPAIGLIARLILSSSDAANACMLRLYPILTDNRQTLFQPRFLSFAEFRNFLDILSNRNEDANIPSLPLSGACDEFGWYLELDIDR